MKKLILPILIVIGAIVFVTLKNDDPKTGLSTKSNVVTEAVAQNKSNDSQAKGDYITLADYQKNPDTYKTSKIVYFFHAGWCPICNQIEKDIKANPGVIPEGVTLIKTDFDSSVQLRQKYGVNTQYTFVQVNSEGKELKQWPGPNIEDAVKEII